MWIIAGGAYATIGQRRSQLGLELDIGRSFGRFNTQTLSSLSTAKPVTPPIFHLLGRGFGQVGSYLNFGTLGPARLPTRIKATGLSLPSLFSGVSYASA